MEGKGQKTEFRGRQQYRDEPGSLAENGVEGWVRSNRRVGHDKISSSRKTSEPKKNLDNRNLGGRGSGGGVTTKERGF